MTEQPSLVKRMHTIRKSCKWRPKATINTVKDCFPITEWLPKYNLRKLQADFIAGFAVGLMIIPQSLAHAIIAGLPPQYGLYSSFPAMFLYMFFGTSKDVSIGTTVITALLTNRYSVTPETNPKIAAALTFLVGIMLIIVALCRLGFIVRFLSYPVISGFVSASAIIIASSQLRYMFGLSKPPRMIFLKLKHFFLNIKYTRPGDVTMGIICLIILFLLKHCSTRNWKLGPDSPRWKRILVKILRLTGIGRNAFIAVLAIVVSYVFHIAKIGDAFRTVGVLPEGLPPFKMPLKSVEVAGNRTLGVGDMVSGYGSGIGVLPLIIVMQSVAASKALGRMNKYKIDTFQEIIGLGFGNLFGSFFGAIPMTASFSRSAINSSSGSKTPLAGVFTSIIVIIAIQFVSPVFRFAPMSSLAAIVIAAVIPLFDYQLVAKLWRLNKLDLVIWVATFLGCLYEIEMGILGGVVLSLAAMLFREFNPRLNISSDIESRKLVIILKGGIWFPGIEAVASRVATKLEKQGKEFDVVVIDCMNMYEIDYTVVHGLHEILADCNINKVRLEFINIGDGKIKEMLEGDGLLGTGKPDPVVAEDEMHETAQETGPLVANGDSHAVSVESNV